MKVIRINLPKLHNEEWFEFFTKFAELVKHFGADKIGVKELFDKLEPLCDKADDLLLVLKKSVYTKKIETADRKRDELFQGFYAVAKGLLKQPVAAKREAAERLYNLLDGYRKSILGHGYAEESAAIHNLLQDLRREYETDVTLLALTDWVTAINQAEQDFQAVYNERIKEDVAKPKRDLKLIRGQADVFYHAIIGTLDTKLLIDGLGGDVAVDPGELDDDVHFEGDDDHEFHGNIVYNFVVTWNETLKKYRNLLRQRAGRAAQGNEPGIEES